MGSNNPTRRRILKLGGIALGAAVVPFSATSALAASPNARFSLDFSTAADAEANTPPSAGWVTDRTEPTAWTTDQGRLRIDIDETGDITGFYAYQGKKYQDANGTYWNAGTGSRLSYRFYIDPDWETDGVEQQTGVWPVLGTADGNISAYPIMAYVDSDASDTDEAKFRSFVYRTDSEGTVVGEWVDIPLSKKLGIDPDEGGWVDVECQLQQINEGAAVKWRINNTLVLDERGYNVTAPSAQFLEVIVNSVNYGVEQSYYYDDFELTEPGAAKNR
ncbi:MULTISPECIES: hypothetical protein [Haloferax]|uniref:hypothetical protein n=1 Tax=Haloferax TaxID=2251 RepID=UPI00177A9B42|nr:MULTISPECIES: hypothetical protein [Haloferax]